MLSKLKVLAPKDAEIDVVGSDLRPVDHGVGELELELAHGLYKISASLGGHVATELISLESARTVRMSVSVRSPFVPSLDEFLPQFVSRLLEPNLTATPVFLSPKNLSDSDSSSILVCFGPYDETTDPNHLSEVTIMPWRGVANSHRFFADMRAIELGQEQWQAVRYQVPPGTYQIECDKGELQRRQVVPVLVGFETRVFAVPECHNLGRDLNFFVDARCPHEPPWSDTGISEAEVAQNALWHNRQIVVDDAAIRKYLDEKFADPILGLSAAFLMIAALRTARDQKTDQQSGSRDGQPPRVGFTPQLIGVVFRNLVRLFTGKRRGKDDVEGNFELPPDLVALGLIAEPFAEEKLISHKRYQIMTPPLFYRSWEFLKSNASRDGRVWINRRLWSELARSAPIGPYFAWHPTRTRLEDVISQVKEAEDHAKELEEAIRETGVKAATYADFLRKNAPDQVRALNEKREHHELSQIVEEASESMNPKDFEDLLVKMRAVAKFDKFNLDSLTPERLVELARVQGIPQSVASAIHSIARLGDTLKSRY